MWRHGVWRVTHALPLGVSGRTSSGARVRAGDVLASGTAVGSAVRVPGARRIGVPAAELARYEQVPVGSEVRGGMVLARTGRRFARVATAPIDGRYVHRSSDGDLYVAPVVGRWDVRSTMDGEVTRSDEQAVVVDGEAWSLGGLAAYGPDAVGDLALGVDAPFDELQPSRVDVRLRGTILVAGARATAEAITRAHACGVAGLVAGAAPAGGLRVVYGDDVLASGAPGREDRPTVLCLLGFGSASLPAEVFSPFVALVGARAAIHVASARLFVFADAGAGDFAAEAPELALAGDYGGVRPLESRGELIGATRFASEVVADAMTAESGPLPLANVLPYDAER